LIAHENPSDEILFIRNLVIVVGPGWIIGLIEVLSGRMNSGQTVAGTLMSSFWSIFDSSSFGTHHIEFVQSQIAGYIIYRTVNFPKSKSLIQY
jgi:hypothetical protein